MSRVRWVYVVDADFGTKIGITGAKEPDSRCKEFWRNGNSSARLVRAWQSDDALAIEQVVLYALEPDRIIGEWLSTHPLVVCEAVSRVMRWTPTERQAYLFRQRYNISEELAQAYAAAA